VGEYGCGVSGVALWAGGVVVVGVDGDCLWDCKSKRWCLEIGWEDPLRAGLVKFAETIL
jgi:hypothetical protein